jgi:hypothetical protein
MKMHLFFHTFTITFNYFGENGEKIICSERVNAETYHEGAWGIGYIDSCVLNLGTRRKWVVKFTPRPFYSRKSRASDTSWEGSWVHYRTSLCAVENREMSCACRVSNPDLSVFHPFSIVAILTELSRFGIYILSKRENNVKYYHYSFMFIVLDVILLSGDSPFQDWISSK